jgi:hypothetical protein
MAAVGVRGIISRHIEIFISVVPFLVWQCRHALTTTDRVIASFSPFSEPLALRFLLPSELSDWVELSSLSWGGWSCVEALPAHRPTQCSARPSKLHTHAHEVRRPSLLLPHTRGLSIDV